MAAGWQLTMYSKSVSLTFHGYDYGQFLSFLPLFFLVGMLAPLVSYRRRDALLVLVPIWGLVVLWTIGSRLARLHDRDWPPRPDEVRTAARPRE